MPKVEFTDWDIKALTWLPADAAWRDNPGTKMRGALESLWRYHEMAEVQWIDGQVWRARLTESGVRAKSALGKLAQDEKKLRIAVLGLVKGET
jgi:hypothetical protein